MLARGVWCSKKWRYYAVASTWECLELVYGVTLGLRGLATLLALAQSRFTAPTPFLIFVAAVAGSVFYSGLGPGFFTTRLGLVIGDG